MSFAVRCLEPAPFPPFYGNIGGNQRVAPSIPANGASAAVQIPNARVYAPLALRDARRIRHDARYARDDRGAPF